MHGSSCPKCGAASDGSNKSCGSCGAVCVSLLSSPPSPSHTFNLFIPPPPHPFCIFFFLVNI
ncbi:hypothetical protein QBC42DRAFT_182114 [Cladorrhinum samala]|uniref:Uncharacterized protein n=1 Tax=Cladorrhinum samala TaxID=585594 RepID=A0AAV9HH13_9PEZI|nr:hypothetical protein QBC42DRAFT_182114 [Cladorrhinum samala]